MAPNEDEIKKETLATVKEKTQPSKGLPLVPNLAKTPGPPPISFVTQRKLFHIFEPHCPHLKVDITAEPDLYE